MTFFAYTPFTGLGLYNGFRGNRWLRNRIKVFKQFVIPSLLNQTDQDFIHWISWRPEERSNPHVKELEQWLSKIEGYKFVFTYGGLCFWDDKYDDETARKRLTLAIQESGKDLVNLLSDEVVMLIQPSDDLYNKHAIGSFKEAFKDPNVDAVTFTKGYLMNYNTKEVLEYNPNTNPPFFAIRFKRDVFLDPNRHIEFTGPYKSHEYIGDKLRLAQFDGRGFMVGTHGENVSTHFNHPFGGEKITDPMILDLFGLRGVPPLKLPLSIRKWVMRRLPYQWQRKLRYIFGEKIYLRFYNYIRS